MMAAARPATWMFVVALMMSSTAYADPACDALNGERTFSDKCATCHSVKGAEPGPVGPNLANVVGRLPGKSKGFAYSDAMRAQRQRWTPERLDWFLTDPLGRVTGTSMSFTGLRNAAARADVICYLVKLGREAR